MNLIDPRGLESNGDCTAEFIATAQCTITGGGDTRPIDDPTMYGFILNSSWNPDVGSHVGGGGQGTGGKAGPQNPVEHPHEDQGNLPFNNCAEFVEFLVREAVASFYDQPYNRDSKAKTLGVHLMGLAFNGYDRHANNGWDGFKDVLTVPGGQHAGVYGHVLGQGGAKLGGLTTMIVGGLADAYDTAQRVLGDEQGPAEMAGNLAGWAVGGHIYNFLTGKTPSEPDRQK